MARAVNPSWWTDGSWNGEPIRNHLARRDVQAIFQYLKSRSWSSAAIAAATGLGAGRVREIVNGRRRVAEYEVFERIATGLKIPRPLMGLGYEDATAASTASSVEPVDHRELLGVVAAVAVGSVPAGIDRWLPPPVAIQPPAAVTADDVATIRAVTTFHRQLDVAGGGGGCLQSARGYVAWATRLLSVPSASEQVFRELQVALAELHGLVGWVAHDLDRHDIARRHLTQSLVLARETNSLPLLANGLYRLGRVSLHQHQPEEALHLFGLGQVAAQQARCPASTAILHNNIAWAYAQLGLPDQVQESLHRARDELDRARNGSPPTWTRFALADADPHGITGVIYTALACHDEHRRFADQALDEALKAVELREPQERRSYTFDVISVATASTLLGEYGEAATWGEKAMALAGEVRSARVHDRLSDVCRIADANGADDPRLQALQQRLASLRVE